MTPAYSSYRINEGPEFEDQAHGEIVTIQADSGFGVGLRDLETGKVTLIDGVTELFIERPYEEVTLFSYRVVPLPLGYLKLELSVEQSRIVHYDGEGYVDATAEEVPDEDVEVLEPGSKGELTTGPKLLGEGSDE